MGSVNAFLLSTKREEQKENGVWIKVRVKTERGRYSIDERENEYVINVKSKAEKGKANLEILKEFKKLFKTNVQIIYGVKSHTKVIFIEGITLKEFQRKIGHLVREHAS